MRIPQRQSTLELIEIYYLKTLYPGVGSDLLTDANVHRNTPRPIAWSQYTQESVQAYCLQPIYPEIHPRQYPGIAPCLFLSAKVPRNWYRLIVCSQCTQE